MANILTAAEAAVVLRTTTDDANMLALLPQVDAYLQNATGWDWAADAVISETAKAAARMLLVQWHENPGGLGGQQTALNFGLTACLVQMEALALVLLDPEEEA